MLYKKVVKRGIKDLTFIQKVLAEKLGDKAIVEINASAKMVDNILIKYGRIFKCWNSKYLDTDYLIYNDEKYSFYLDIEHNKVGKYGSYYEMTIINNEKSANWDFNKCKEDFLKHDIKSFKKDNIDIFKIGYYDTLLELWEHDYIKAFDPFAHICIKNSTSKERIINNFDDERRSILNKLNKIAEENGDFYYY